MKPRPFTFAGALAIGTLLLTGCATNPSTDEHAAHHVEGGPVAASVPSATYDQQMKTMQDMHRKMMSAMTPEERQALMADHMKAMQGGTMMREMGQMASGARSGTAQQDMMDRCMKMQDMMMQTMMDRQTPPVRLR